MGVLDKIRRKYLPGTVPFPTGYRPPWIWGTVGREVDLSGVDLRGSTIVESCLQALEIAFTEPSLVVHVLRGDQPDIAPDHPLSRLIDEPNPLMSWDLLDAYVLRSMLLEGNGYILKVRNRAGEVVELWPLDPRYVNPQGDQYTLITHYEYHPPGLTAPVRLETSDVIHRRVTIDDDQPRKGYSRLRVALREVLTDEEAARFTAAFLTNAGVPSILLVPKEGTYVDEETLIAAKRLFQEEFSGAGRGRVVTTDGRWEVHQLSFSPEQMQLADIRTLPEERICSLLGVPPIIVGLGAGLEHATYSNYEQAREAFYEGTLVPLWRRLGRQMHRAFADDFGLSRDVYLAYDLSGVRALSEGEDALMARHLQEVQAGVRTVAEYRAAHNMQVSPEHHIFLRSAAVLEVPDRSAPQAGSASEQSSQGEEQPGQGEASQPGEQGGQAEGNPPGEQGSKALRSKADRAPRYIARRTRTLRDLEDKWEARIARVLREHLREVIEAYVSEPKAATQLPRDPSDPEKLRARLRLALQDLYAEVSSEAVDDATLFDLELQWDVRNPAIAQFLDGIARRPTGAVQSVPETVRDAIRDVISQGLERGYSIHQIANGVPEEEFVGLRGVMDATVARARTIARTETATTYNLSASYAYRTAGIGRVQVLDGDQDPPCSEVNGTIQTLEWADANPIAHPNCVRAFIPLV